MANDTTDKLLNMTLKINAVFSLLSGLDILFLDRSIGEIIFRDRVESLLPTGVMLIIFAIFVYAVSSMRSVNKYLVGAIIILDALWVLGSIALIAFGGSIISAYGAVMIGGVAAIIASFAIFQIIGLRRALYVRA